MFTVYRWVPSALRQSRRQVTRVEGLLGPLPRCTVVDRRRWSTCQRRSPLRDSDERRRRRSQHGQRRGRTVGRGQQSRDVDTKQYRRERRRRQLYHRHADWRGTERKTQQGLHDTWIHDLLSDGEQQTKLEDDTWHSKRDCKTNALTFKQLFIYLFYLTIHIK